MPSAASHPYVFIEGTWRLNTASSSQTGKKSCGRRHGPSRSITASIVMSPILSCLIFASPRACWGQRNGRLKAVQVGGRAKVRTCRSAESQSASAFAGVTPGLVPILARGIDDAAVGLEELVGDLEDREHQSALRTPRDVPAALVAPDEFAGLAFDALRRAFLVDEAALENVGLLDMDVLVVRQHRTRREPHQRGHQAAGAIEQQRLGLAAGEAGLLPVQILWANDVGMRIGGLRTLRRHGVHG